MDKRETELRTRFTDAHGITAEEFLSVVTGRDEPLVPGDDIGFVLAVHHAQLRSETDDGLYTASFLGVSFGGVRHIALLKAQHLAFFFHHRMNDQDRETLAFLDAFTTQPGWLPVQHYYDNLYETLMGLPAPETVAS